MRTALTENEKRILYQVIDDTTEDAIEQTLADVRALIFGNRSVVPKALILWRDFRMVVRDVCERVMLGFHGKGWPDLTLFRGNSLRFIEVKQGRDTFARSQPYWVRNFAIPLKLQLDVLNVHV